MMGRKRKYQTDEEKRIAKNEKAMRYYEKNKDEIRRKNRERYHRKKMEKHEESEEIQHFE